MKVLNKVVIGMASLVLLTGCMSKTGYSDFHSKAVEAEKKAPEYKKATAKGEIITTILSAETKVTVDCKFVKNSDGDWEVDGENKDGALVAVFYLSFRASAVGDSGDYTYYAGSGGFKATSKNEDSAASYVFNKFGYPTSVKGKSDSGNVNLKFTWAK